MYPSWLHVEYAITFLKSFWVRPIVEEKNAVKLPTKIISNSIIGVCSNIGDNLIIKNTPAVTIVAAWIKAETGVGPSMASGNHMCKPIWADLPITPNNNSIDITFKIFSWHILEYENKEG